MLDWNLNQYKAAGKHVASFAAGGVGMAAALHFLSPSQAVDVNGNLTQIFNGLEQVATGIAGLGTILVPIYTALRAAHNANPTVQAQALVTVANAGGTQAIEANAAIANAVIESKDLKLNGTISAPAEVADAVPSEKVVAK